MSVGFEQEIAIGAVRRVLVLDDDRDWGDTTRDYLMMRSPGLVVDVARSISEAERLLEDGAYEVLLVDVSLEEGRRFGGGPVGGDEWLCGIAEEQRRPVKVVITAYPNRIADRATLAREGIAVIQKGTEEETECLDRIAAAWPGQAQPLGSSGRVLRRPQERWTSTVVQEAEALLLEWLEDPVPEPNEQVWMGARAYSLEELAEAIRRRAPEGERLLEMMLRYLRSVLSRSRGSGSGESGGE